jgi:hypothetical protein
MKPLSTGQARAVTQEMGVLLLLLLLLLLLFCRSVGAIENLGVAEFCFRQIRSKDTGARTMGPYSAFMYVRKRHPWPDRTQARTQGLLRGARHPCRVNNLPNSIWQPWLRGDDMDIVN